MKQIKNFLLVFCIMIFIVLQFFLVKTLKNLYSFDKFLLIANKIENITNLAFSFDENFANLSKNTNCAIFKIPSINEKNFLIKNFFDYAIVLYYKNNLFFNLQPSNLSTRKTEAFHIKNIKDFNFKYLNNTLEFSGAIDGIYYSADFFMEKQFVRIPFYNKKVFK